MPIPPDAYVLVIGAMRSGTSTFFRYITKHPRIAASRIKEPEYFSEFQGHGADVERYEDLWDYDPAVHRYCVEASTGYAKYPDEPHVPDRIRAAGLEPRFIYVVRDPIQRMESQFNHGWLHRDRYAYGDFGHPSLLDLSRYYMQLQQYLLRFPDRSRYRIVDFDAMVADSQSVMDGVFRWLALDSVPIPATRANPTPERSALEVRLANVNLSAPLRLVPSGLKSRVKELLRKRVPGNRRMTPEEREKARRFLERDVRLFGSEFGFPVEKWGF